MRNSSATMPHFLARLARVVLVGALVAGVSYVSYAQITGSDILRLGRSASATARGGHDLFDLTIAIPNHDTAFDVSGGQGFAMDVFHSSLITLSLIDPQGRTITAGNASSSGATFQVRTVPADVKDVIFALPGTHLYVTVNNPALGHWTARVQASSPPASVALNIVTFGDGTHTASSTINRADGIFDQGAQGKLFAGVMRNDSELTGITVTAKVNSLSSPSTSPTVVTLRDDGVAPDVAANNGTYTGTPPTGTMGSFVAFTTFKSASGAVLGTSLTYYSVKAPAGRIRGTVRDLGPVDEDGDGLTDYFALGLDIEAGLVGEYDAVVYLVASNGKEFQATGGATLSPGQHQLTVRAYGSDLKMALGAGANGPYTMRLASVSYTPPESQPGPSRNLGTLSNQGSTRAYDLATFARPYLAFKRYLGDRGVDTDGNGKFNEIELRFELDSAVELPDDFLWNGTLVPVAGLPVGGSSLAADGRGQIVKGTNTITLTFKAREFAMNRVAGPYVLKDFSLYPSGGWPAPYNAKHAEEAYDIPSEIGPTAAYTADQLDLEMPGNLAGLLAFVRGVVVAPGKPAALKAELVGLLEGAQVEVTAGRVAEARTLLKTFVKQVTANTRATNGIGGNNAFGYEDGEVMYNSGKYVSSRL